MYLLKAASYLLVAYVSGLETTTSVGELAQIKWSQLMMEYYNHTT